MSSSDSDSGHDSYYSLTDSNSSLTFSVFGFVCEICHVRRAIKQSDLEDQFLNEEIYLKDQDDDIWLKCDECASTYHKTCWETYNNYNITVRFVCCE